LGSTLATSTSAAIQLEIFICSSEIKRMSL